jgi:hypothetical protein
MKQKADPKACSLNERVLVINYSLARRTNQPGKKEKAAGISSSGLRQFVARLFFSSHLPES